MDRRQQKSRAAIFEAFSNLLSQKSYSRITVQDIIDAANVGRTTFYAHFPTKDDLLHELCHDLFAHVFSDTPGVADTHDFSVETGNAHAILSHILYHLRDSIDHTPGIIRGESRDLFLQFFQHHLIGHFETLIPCSHVKQPEIPRKYFIGHLAGSFLNLVQWWIEDEFQTAPDTLTDYYMAVNGHVLAYRSILEELQS